MSLLKVDTIQSNGAVDVEVNDDLNVTGTLSVGDVDLAGSSGSSLVGFVQSGIGAIPETTEDALQRIVFAEQYSTFAQAVTAAVGGRLRVNSAITISADTTVPPTVELVVENGGSFAIATTKTLYIRGPFQAGDYVVFTGAGTVDFNEGTRHHNLAWYEGASLDLKWDFCRRGLIDLYPYTAHIPHPQKDDPAADFAVVSSRERWYWKVAAPLYFDDPENRGDWTIDGHMVATATMDAMMIFSPTNKTEDLIFRTNFLLDCDNKATYGIDIQGAARVKFDKQVYILDCTRGVRLQTTSLAISDVEFHDIYIAGFSGAAVRVEGIATAAIGNRFGSIFAQVADSASANVLEIVGDVRDLNVDVIHYDTAGGSDVAAGVYIEGNSSVRPLYSINIGVIYGNVMTVGLKTRLASGTTEIEGVKVGYISPSHVASTTVDLEYLKNSIVEAQVAGHTQTVASTAQVVSLPECSAFTPVIEGQSAAGTGTYTVQVGRYRVVGDLVHISITLVWTAHDGTGNLIITGLPVTAANVNASHAWPLSVLYSSLLVAAGKELAAAVINNSATIRLYNQDPSGGGAAQIAIDTAGTLNLSGWFER